MVKHPPLISWKRLMGHLGLALGCVTVAFVLGIQSVGEMQPVALIRAGGTELGGDFTGDGKVTVEDAILAIEIAERYVTPTVDQLKADVNGDYVITVDDGLTILRSLTSN